MERLTLAYLLMAGLVVVAACIAYSFWYNGGDRSARRDRHRERVRWAARDQARDEAEAAADTSA